MICNRNTCPIVNCAVKDQVYTDSDSCCPVCKTQTAYKQCEYEGRVHEVREEKTPD